jgi:RNA-directed DNA polymerase
LSAAFSVERASHVKVLGSYGLGPNFMNALTKVSDWKGYFRDIGLPVEIIDRHLILVEKQLSSRVPVIFDVEHLAKLLGVSDAYLASAISVPEFHYRNFSIPKKSGGTRNISSPRSALKDVQRWILKNILYSASPSSVAMGFRHDRSILDHAKTHCHSPYILKLDVADFFPSIKFSRVIGLYQGFGYSAGVAYTLASLCCLDGSLPQGAATSPALSNLVCRRLDVRLYSLAKKLRLKFSRYADDMAFSGRSLNLSVLPLVKLILAEEGFELRDDKTRLYSEGAKRILTGLSASMSGVKLLRKDRRELRAVFHEIRKYGIIGYIFSHKIRDPLFLDRLIGKFSFWCFIEASCKFPREATVYLKKIKLENGM